jgi:hypothetical protein
MILWACLRRESGLAVMVDRSFGTLKGSFNFD